MQQDFGIKLELPEGRLCPPVRKLVPKIPLIMTDSKSVSIGLIGDAESD